MSLKALFGADWHVWDLRNAVFPLGVVYPAHRLALAIGVDGIPGLVFAGRLVVAILSSAGISLLGAAACFRFSEILFLVPAIAQLLLARRVGAATILGVHLGDPAYLTAMVPKGAWVAIDHRTRSAALVEQQLALRRIYPRHDWGGVAISSLAPAAGRAITNVVRRATPHPVQETYKFFQNRHAQAAAVITRSA